MRSLFLNICTKNLDKTKVFFGKLGFQFNSDFTNDDAACMIIDDNLYAMIHTPASFARFTDKKITDPAKETECLYAIGIESDEAVNKMIENAIAAGGTEHREPQDHGFMYYRAFTDLDGHIWEVLHLRNQ